MMNVEIMQFMEPLIYMIGRLTLFLLSAVGLVYLVKILIKPILIIVGCAAVGYLVYTGVLVMAG